MTDLFLFCKTVFEIIELGFALFGISIILLCIFGKDDEKKRK